MEKTMDKIVALAKSRGFVYPGFRALHKTPETAWQIAQKSVACTIKFNTSTAFHGLHLLVFYGKIELYFILTSRRMRV